MKIALLCDRADKIKKCALRCGTARDRERYSGGRVGELR